ncbi:hypothetical protein ACIO6T_30975 [Streptomyces sp. NPDC087532]
MNHPYKSVRPALMSARPAFLSARPRLAERPFHPESELDART